MLSAQYMYMRKSMSLQLRARTNTKATPKGSRRNRKEQYLSWAFALPALTLLLIFLIIPFVLTIYFSLTNQRLAPGPLPTSFRSEEHTSELQSQSNLVCRLLLEKKKAHC